MDHLWIDHEMQYEPDAVPYQEPDEWEYAQDEDIEWANKIELSYRSRKSMVFRLVCRSMRIRHVSRGVYYQEGIFFRMLSRYHDLLGLHFHRDDYTIVKDGVTVLSTLKLYGLVEKMLEVKSTDRTPFDCDLMSYNAQLWKTRDLVNDKKLPGLLRAYYSSRHAQKKSTNIREVKIDKHLLTSMKVLLEEFAEKMEMEFQQSFDLDVSSLRSLAACYLLLAALVHAFQVIFADTPARKTARFTMSVWLLENICLTWARQNGVCVHRLCSSISTNIELSQAYIAAGMKFDGKHESCQSDKYCQAKSPVIVLPAHNECNGCPTVVLSDKRGLEDCIETNGYGLLKFDKGLDFSVVQTGKYVAFSHVWSHGLGNPYENGLPECQLKRLKSYVEEADCDSFWLDPICVPLDSTSKLRAIEKMDVVYKKAAKVIVLDRDLLKCRGNSVTKQIATALSDWITRIWTLQEALFAGDNLYVAFADGLVHFNTLVCDEKDFLLVSPIRSLLSTDSSSVVRLAEDFQLRTTTRPEDEAICLSILLGIPLCVGQVPDVIARLDSIEQDLVYVRGERCGRKGLRWCPVSLLSADEPSRYRRDQLKVRLGEKGLLMKKDVLKLGSIMFRPLMKYLILLDTESFVALGPSGATPAQLEPRHIEDTALVLEAATTDFPKALLVSNASGDAHYECLMMLVKLSIYDAEQTPGATKDMVKVQATRLRDFEIWVD